jgi:hypothetical protein
MIAIVRLPPAGGGALGEPASAATHGARELLVAVAEHGGQ